MEGDDAIDEEDQEDIGGDVLEIQSIKDLDPMKIVVEVMASLPNSLRKALVPSSSEKVATKLVEVNTSLPSTQLTSRVKTTKCNDD